MKERLKNNKSILIISLSVFITVVSLTTLILVYNYKRLELKNKAEIDKMFKESQLNEANEWNKQSDINDCINTAKTNRTSLWNANCKNGTTNCSLQQETINWIDARYNAEVNTCLERYK